MASNCGHKNTRSGLWAGALLAILWACHSPTQAPDFYPSETLSVQTKASAPELWQSALRDAAHLMQSVGSALPLASMGSDPCSVLVPSGSQRQKLAQHGALDAHGLMRGQIYFVGLQAMVQAIATRSTGIDYVWDADHQQFAVFTYRGNGYSVAAGTSTSAYVGMAVTNQPSVIDAWAGYFLDAGADVGIPGVEKFISGMVQGFVSSTKPPRPDFSTFGVSGGVQAGVTLSADGAVFPISNPVVGTSLYEPSRALTLDAFARLNPKIGLKNNWFKSSLKEHKSGSKYIQFEAKNPLLANLAMLPLMVVFAPASAPKAAVGLIAQGIKQSLAAMGQPLVCKTK